MTSLPETRGPKRLALAIDLDTCVGCHACVTSCKEWNAGGDPAPLGDVNAYQAGQRGAWANRVFTYEAGDGATGRTVHFPKNCFHCETPQCVTVCPTGASYKRAEDGIVLVDYDKCIGCKLCAWACPYGARELDEVDGTMKKCTLCIDRIYNRNLRVEERQPACVLACPSKARHFGDFNDADSSVSRLSRERGGFRVMEALGQNPTGTYLPPRPGKRAEGAELPKVDHGGGRFLRWIDKMLTR